MQPHRSSFARGSILFPILMPARQPRIPFPPLWRGGMAGPLAAALIPIVTCRSDELFENSQNVILAHDEEFFALDLDLSSRIPGEQNAIPFLDDERNGLTIL